jgi:hypothetical protein
MYNVEPDQNGQIVITISPNSVTSQFGLIGALVVQETSPSTSQVPATPSFVNRPVFSGEKSQIQEKQTDRNAKNILSVYPNPFSKDFMLSFNTEKAGDVKVELYNISGKLVLAKSLGKVPKGKNSLRLIPDQGITAGVYLLKLTYLNEGRSSYIKLIKQ